MSSSGYKKMYDRFRKHMNRWLKEHSASQEATDDWLLGENLVPYVKTTCIKESSMKKTPYHVYYRYKVANKSDTSTASNTTNNKKNKTDTNKKPLTASSSSSSTTPKETDNSVDSKTENQTTSSTTTTEQPK